MDAVPTHTGRRRAFEAEGTKMQRMGRGLRGHRKQSLRKEKKVQWGLWFFPDQSCISLTFSTRGPSWLPGTNLVPSRILPDVHQGLQRSSRPSRTTGHRVGGWGKWKSFALCTFGQNVSCRTAAGLPDNLASLILIA